MNTQLRSIRRCTVVPDRRKPSSLLFRQPQRDMLRAATIAVVVVGLLYLGVAAATVLVLGSRAGATAAPLAQLLAIGIGGRVQALSAVAALLLTFGTINAYFAGAAKLGAALGRDGALPAWLAHGNQAGDVPRRSLALIADVSLFVMTGWYLLWPVAIGLGALLYQYVTREKRARRAFG